MLGRADVVGGDEVIRQLVGFVFGKGFGVGIEHVPVGQQLVGIYVHLLLAFLTLADHVTAVHVSESRLDTVAHIIGQGQADGARGRNGGVVGIAAALFGNLVLQFPGKLLHVATVTTHEHRSLDRVTDLVAVLGHFRTMGQHLVGNGVLIGKDRCDPLFLGQLDTHAPTDLGHFPGHTLGEFQGFGVAIFHAQHGEG